MGEPNEALTQVLETATRNSGWPPRLGIRIRIWAYC